MNIFTTIRNIFRSKSPGSYAPPIVNYLPLKFVTRELLTPAETAFYCNLTGPQLSQWEMGYGPIRPTTETVAGQIWIRFRTADVRSIAGDSK